MSTTPNLGLALLDSSLWQSTYFKDFITALSGNSSMSNMMKLDAVIAALQSEKADLIGGKVPEDQLPEISSLTLGETETTAYRGDYGKVAYDHAQSIENPHQVTKNQVGLGNVDNTSDLNKPISTATQAALDAITAQIGDIASMVDTINGEVI